MENMTCVAVKHENDKYFENRLVMGHTDCKCNAGFVETLKIVSKRKPGPL